MQEAPYQASPGATETRIQIVYCGLKHEHLFINMEGKVSAPL